jgi:hypothetical protein
MDYLDFLEALAALAFAAFLSTIIIKIDERNISEINDAGINFSVAPNCCKYTKN